MEKHVKFLEITLESTIWWNLHENLADLALKVINDPKLVRDSRSSLKLLTFQLSNFRALDNIKYALDLIYIFPWILRFWDSSKLK